jgi:hypothetical protein
MGQGDPGRPHQVAVRPVVTSPRADISRGVLRRPIHLKCRIPPRDRCTLVVLEPRTDGRNPSCEHSSLLRPQAHHYSHRWRTRRSQAKVQRRSPISPVYGLSILLWFHTTAIGARPGGQQVPHTPKDWRRRSSLPVGCKCPPGEQRGTIHR